LLLLLAPVVRLRVRVRVRVRVSGFLRATLLGARQQLFWREHLSRRAQGCFVTREVPQHLRYLLGRKIQRVLR